MLGDHALWGKTVFYRQSVTVPCILRPPGGITGRVSNALVELIDVPATLRDIAGAEPLDSAMGCSLCEHLTSDSTGKEAIVSDLFGQTMLRTRHHKLVFGTVDKRPHQLFDLEGDPDERENRVFDAPRHRAARPLDGTVRRPHRSDRVRALPGLREAIRQPQLAAGRADQPARHTACPALPMVEGRLVLPDRRVPGRSGCCSLPFRSEMRTSLSVSLQASATPGLLRTIRSTDSSSVRPRTLCTATQRSSCDSSVSSNASVISVCSANLQS